LQVLGDDQPMIRREYASMTAAQDPGLAHQVVHLLVINVLTESHFRLPVMSAQQTVPIAAMAISGSRC
jgi:hypothetical protein